MIGCLPAASVLVVQVAVEMDPPTCRAAPMQSGEAPSRKSTVPLGIWPVTFNVNVTLIPGFEGLGDDVRLTAGGGTVTICVNGKEMLPRLLASPE